MRSDGVLGDLGPLSFLNVMRGLFVLIVVMALFFGWRESPWFPWS